MKICKLKDSTYQRRIYLVLGGTKKEFIEWYENKFKDDEDNDLFAYATTFFPLVSDRQQYVLWVPVITMRLKNIIHIVAHEVLHIVFEVLNKVGVQRTAKNDEPYTYYFDSLLKQVLKRIELYKN